MGKLDMASTETRSITVRRMAWAGACLAALAAVAPTPAQPQLAVVCGNCTDEFTEIGREAARVQNVLMQIRTLEAQLQQMEQVYASVAHLPDAALNELGQTLNVAQFRNPLPSGSAQMGSIMNGSGLSLMTGLGQQYFGQNHIFSPAGPGFSSSDMASNANGIAGVQAMASQLYQSAAAHMGALQGLENLLAGSPDAKGVADITARVQTEQTYFAAQQVQAQAMGNWQAAQVRSSEQQRRESRRCYIEAALHDLDSGSQASAGVDSCAQPAAAAAGGPAGNGAAAGDPSGAGSGASVGSGYDQFRGQSVGSGQCVALVQASDPGVGLTRTWTQGPQVMGNASLQPGTAIATFDASGHYANATDGSSHAAIYLGQNAQGMQVMDQWVGHAASIRTIPWSNTSGAANTGSAFYVINH